MDLNKIQEEWKKDSKIDDILLDKHSLEIPQLHCKYLNYLSEVKLLKKRKEIQLRQAKSEAWLFYSGKDIPEKYREINFNFKVLKSDVNNWIDNDKYVTELEQQLEYYNVMLDVLVEIIKQISNRTFQIKNSIEAKKFYQGYN